MKLYLSIALCASALFIISCSSAPTAEESAIIAFEQSESDGADLAIDFKEVKMEKSISILDSMKLLHNSAFSDAFSLEKNYIDTFYNETLIANQKSEKQLAEYEEILSGKPNANTKQVYEKAKADLMPFLEKNRKRLERYTAMKKDNDRYMAASDKDAVLGVLYSAKFSYTNPETNKKQGKSRKYMFSPDGSKVLHVAK